MLKLDIRVIALIQLLCLFLTGCGHANSSANDPRTLTSMISVEGSDTMMSLVKAWADAYHARKPETPISTTSADSGAGIKALIGRTIDLAVSSRELDDSELQIAHKKNVHLQKTTVARDAMAIVVNPHNPVKAISLSQLRQIYKGELINWSKLKGTTEPIVAYSREKNSGTYEFFHDHVMKGETEPNSIKLMPSIERLVDSVSKQSGALAYMGMGHALAAGNKVKILEVQLMDGAPGVMPSSATLADTYPLSRPLFVFTDENPKPSVREFVDFCTSAEGQKLVPETGYVSIR